LTGYNSQGPIKSSYDYYIKGFTIQTLTEYDRGYKYIGTFTSKLDEECKAIADVSIYANEKGKELNEVRNKIQDIIGKNKSKCDKLNTEIDEIREKAWKKYKKEHGIDS